MKKRIFLNVVMAFVLIISCQPDNQGNDVKKPKPYSYMELDCSGDGFYYASVSLTDKTKRLEFYLHSEDSSSRVANIPFIGAYDPFRCDISDSSTDYYLMKNLNAGWTLRQPAEFEQSESVMIAAAHFRSSNDLPFEFDGTSDNFIATIGVEYEAETTVGLSKLSLEDIQWVKVDSVPGAVYTINYMDGVSEINTENYFYDDYQDLNGTYFNYGRVDAWVFDKNGELYNYQINQDHTANQTDDEIRSIKATDDCFYIAFKCVEAFDGNAPYNWKLYIEKDPLSVEPLELEWSMDYGSLGISYQLIKELASVKKSDGSPIDVITVVSEDNRTVVQNAFDGQLPGYTNISYLTSRSDGYWTRDYGPWIVSDDTGNFSVAKHRYERLVYGSYRPNDDLVGVTYANAYSIPYNMLQILQAGGNYMTDGQGLGYSTAIIFSQNNSWTDPITDIDYSYTDEEILDTVSNALGLRDYRIIEDVFGPGIQHIDCWAKLLSVEKVMIIKLPSSASADQLERVNDAVDYFETHKTSYGTNYQIYRVESPNGQPYCNSLILNDTIFVPITGSSETADNNAISAYRRAMPGYTIKGISGHPSNGWRTNDALHCRTKDIADRDMLYIELIHVKYENDIVTFKVKITPYSGSNVIEDQTGVYWRLN